MSKHNDNEYRSYQITTPDNEHLSVTDLSADAALNSVAGDNREGWQVQTVETDENYNVIFVNAHLSSN